MKVRAIRGAVTCSANTEQDILNETRELLIGIVEKNSIRENDIISIIFTVTNDLNAAFPAVAARSMGWTDIPLMCSNEIPVPGSLEKCIRVMMHINTEKDNKDIKHVFLKGARSLRPDLSQD
ncbi:MAG: chorismate mutase [Bacillota bacterium]|nr:chorismate mutase [Bacillota bacterium]